MNTKIGRNEPCPCGSGHKYKRCHGDPTKNNEAYSASIDTLHERAQALEFQRTEQQGKAKPIISATIGDNRVVLINNLVAKSKHWGTFHEFLFSYLTHALGSQWFHDENRKDIGIQHSIVRWFNLLQQQLSKPHQWIENIAMSSTTGAVAACLDLAYHLYLLAHNIDLQSVLIKRLKSQDHSHFIGAMAETHTIAAFIKAKFSIDFEDESDGSTTHCEFTAISENGKKYSVEVKARAAFKGHADIYTQLKKALNKRAKYPRIVFIEMNILNTLVDDIPDWVLHLESIWKEMERDLKLPNGGEAPPAYVFFINHPYEQYLEDKNYNYNAFLTGFKILGFEQNHAFPSLEAMLEHRDLHRDIYELFDAYKKYKDVPSTFEAQNPIQPGQSTFGRYLIGDIYSVQKDDGTFVDGRLDDAIVTGTKTMLVFSCQDGTSTIFSYELSADELAAYKAHPHTYFGQVREQKGVITDPLQWFDFFHNCYKQSTKDTLISFMSHTEDIKRLQMLSRDELAKKYALALAAQMHARGFEKR